MKKTPLAAMDSRLRTGLQLENLYQNIQNDLVEVEEKLHLFSSSSNRLISEISSYLFQKGGKRIRPALLLLSAKLFNYRGNEHILMAALVEFIHTASLIHDDIIDNSNMRRGRETVHTRWGPNITVLLGDYLYIKTIGLSLESEYNQVIRILTDTTTKMIEGELTEYSLSGNLGIAEEEYLDIIHKKTAFLFSTSCQIGGILAKASLEELQSLIDYGSHLGMTFQIVDDLLDYQGDEKILGKPTLSDLGEGRVTLPLIYTLNNDGHRTRSRIVHLINKGKIKKESKDEILGILQANGALDYAFRKAEDYTLKAKTAISRFRESIHHETMSLLADYILNRDR